MESLNNNPFEQFQNWFDEACQSQEPQPEAMTLATANRQGVPSARQVLYKGMNKNRFALYTNYLSRKAKEIFENPHAALVFHWPFMERQVRIEGVVQKMSAAESQSYFHSRPRNFQISALTSRQSEIIANREILEQRFSELENEYEGRDIQCPDWWGGFWVKPHTFEFWQKRKKRLHDRIQYRLKSDQWLQERLSP